MKYSLSDYIVTVKLPEGMDFGVDTLSIGGERSYLDSISISLNGTLFTTSADNTGSWVHNKSLNKSGSCSITLSQLADNISYFKKFCNIFYQSDDDYDEGCTITISDRDNIIATCYDCFLTGIPNQQFGNSAASQSWTFTCGQITFAD